MASSTTIPMASTNPKSVNVLIENPSADMPAKVPIRDTGTAAAGIKVARQLWRKRYTTRRTKIMASRKVATTSWIDTSTNRVVSYGIS